MVGWMVALVAVVACSACLVGCLVALALTLKLYTEWAKQEMMKRRGS